MEYPSSSPQRRIRAEHSRTAYLVSSFSQVLKNSTSPASSSSFKRRNVMLHRELGLIPSDNLDFAGHSQMNRNEKQLLQEVNGRFARFIDNVRCLENHNKYLEKEIGDIRERRQFSLADQYDPVIKDLRKQVHDIAQQNRHIEAELDHLEQDLYSLKSKCGQEARHRTNIESGITAMQMHINDAHLSKMELDKKAQSLVKEIHFLKQKHKEEVSEMMAQIHEAHLSTETKSLGTTDITTALRDIRRQLEGHACSDIQQAEERFHALMSNIMEATEKNRKTLQATKQEILEHKRQLQTKSIGLDTLKGAKLALEKQLNVLEEDHDAEVDQYQDTIRSLKLELTNSKFEMSGYCQQYQDLLNVKMALDVEIASYRKLLEGEEMRLDSCTQGPVPYVYRQSPVYTLPYFTRQRGHCYKLMPQFKFVEEIITETTREVELSETEETESERSSSEGLCGDNGSSDGEADVAEVEVTTEEEDTTGSLEEGGARTAMATDGAATGEDGEGEEAVMGADVLPDVEETTEGKQPTVILQDQSTETEDMAERKEEADDVGSAAGDMGESLVEITQEYWSTATEQPITEHRAEAEQPITEHGAEVEQPITQHRAEAEQPIAQHGAEAEQPITEFGAEAEQPITEHGAEAEQPITEQGAEAEQPITENGAEVEQPITEHGAEAEQPITEHGAEAEQPITELGAEAEQPITEHGAEADQPITEHRAEAEQPITELGAEAEQPITEHGAEADQPITEHGAEAEQPITENGAEVEQPITELGAEAEQSITEHGAEADQPITEHGAEAEQPITENGAEAEQPITEHGAKAEQPITEHGAEAEQPITDHGAEETCEGSQMRASSGPLEMDPIEQPHPGGPTQDKPQQENNREKYEMFIVGKEVSGIQESLEEEANGLVKVQESMQPVKAKGHINKEKNASGVDVKPDESPVNGTVDPVTSPDQTGPKLAKCEPDTPLTTIAEPKDIPEKSLGSLSKSEDRSTPTTTLKATPGMEADSAKEEPRVRLKEESFSEMKLKKMTNTMEDPGEKSTVTVIDGDKKS